jgi:hypothetical protein
MIDSLAFHASKASRLDSAAAVGVADVKSPNKTTPIVPEFIHEK